MTDKKILIVFLSQFDLTASKITKIIEFLGENVSLKGFKKAKFPDNILNPEQKEKMILSAEEELVKTYVINLANRGIKIVTKGEKEFPKNLIHIPDCPQILYYMGDLSLANKPSLSVVGSRKPSSYGRLITERLVCDVASAGVVIVSGLAYGIDSIAHRKCLEVGGRTIAILGGGFDHIYPAEHEGLAKEIAQKGLLLSEFRPKYSATKFNFPLRNRIIAGISDGVLITEASFKSGTIHTRDFAFEYDRMSYAVPGNIDSPLSQLPNDMIKSGQAGVVTCSDDILLDYPNLEPLKREEIGNKETEFANLTVSESEQKVLEILQKGIMSTEELAKSAGFSVNILNSCLTTLEIRGLINRLPNGNISLS